MDRARTKIMFNLHGAVKQNPQAFARRATKFFGKDPLPDTPKKDYRGTNLQGHRGKYRVGEQIGEGAVGQVYKGTTFVEGLAVGDEVAIKVGIKHPTISSRFRAEALFLTQLNHPSILKCHDYFEDTEAAYLVTELLKGDVLSNILDSMQIPIKEAVAIGILILEALEEIHSAGIVHRDLKPENIFVCEDGVLKIIDFGVSRIEGGVGLTHTTAGVTMGTPEYMSPEQIGDSNVDTKADLYSFGIILYQMLTGVVPFKSDDPDEGTRSLKIRLQQLDTQPEQVTKHNAAVSKDLEALALKLLSKDKTRRYNSATEVKEELEHLREAELLEITPDTRSSGRRLVDKLLGR